MLTTTPFFRPDAGTVPWPMIVSRPSRLISPISAQTLDVPTSMPTRTASRSTCRETLPTSELLPLDEVAADERHVVEDPEPEADQCHEVQVQAEPVAHEGQEHRDQRVD